MIHLLLRYTLVRVKPNLTCLTYSIIHSQQRMEHKNRDDGNISTLTDERLERLQSIGFRWAKRRGQARWDEKYVSCGVLSLEGRTRERMCDDIYFSLILTNNSVPVLPSSTSTVLHTE